MRRVHCTLLIDYPIFISIIPIIISAKNILCFLLKRCLQNIISDIMENTTIRVATRG